MQWQDHKTQFNSSWLRAQDNVNLTQARGVESEERLWSGGCDIPVYEYSEREKLFDNWMADLKNWGLVFVHGCPTTEKGTLPVLYPIGPIASSPVDSWARSVGAVRLVVEDWLLVSVV